MLITASILSRTGVNDGSVIAACGRAGAALLGSIAHVCPLQRVRLAAKEDRGRARMTHPRQILALQESSQDILERRWRVVGWHRGSEKSIGSSQKHG
jgi:hypothetical protein